jgi:hypothetical protein
MFSIVIFVALNSKKRKYYHPNPMASTCPSTAVFSSTIVKFFFIIFRPKPWAPQDCKHNLNFSWLGGQKTNQHVEAV